jgi:hypothetical protein
VLYSLDGKENITVLWSAKFFPVESTVTYPNGSTQTGISSLFSYYIINASVVLPELPEGSHSISVYGRYDHAGGSNYNVHDNSKVCFTINEGNAPVISIFSVENKTYNINTIPLDFTVNKPTSQITYSLNGEANITISGNTTLSNLTYRTHNITFYATDLAGNIGASETVSFTVSELFPTAVLASSAIIIVVVGLTVLIYFAKLKNTGKTI